jgi:rhodanese-related sulfurtransferase
MPRALDVAVARQQLLAGAQLVEVLPEADYRQEHLPGAVNIPLAELTAERAEADLDPDRPVVVYCFDTQ